MKYLALILISLPAYSNTFVLPETGARFSLKITKTDLKYESEAMTKTISLKPCSLDLAKKLNAEIISKLPDKSEKSGLKFLIDDRELMLSPKSELAGLVTMMDPRILRFAIEEKEACK